MRYGSLFAGYGGLELGVQSILGGSTAWHCEIEPAPSRILAHHWPDVPNLGDITKVDWSVVEPIDVLTGGFPCQDVSHAGKRLGLKPGTRSGLWSHMAYAIDKLRPRLVVAENVRGLLSAEAGGDLEPCTWCVGDGERGALRALGAVLGDLVDLGYDAQWIGVRAADAGAPHGRFRVFVFAWPAEDTHRAARGQWGVAASGQAEGRGARAAAGGRGGAPAADADVPGREGSEPTGGRHLPARRGVTAADAGGERHGGGQDGRRLGPVDGEDAEGPRQRERAREVPGDRGPAAAADTKGNEQRERADAAARPGRLRTEPRHGVANVAWGDYEPAVRRWERLTRPAPAPTEPGKTGQPRLSPAFVEWLMGLPAGHVTDPDIGLTRNEQLKALGNGVVPQQAALATRTWLQTQTVRSAA